MKHKKKLVLCLTALMVFANLTRMLPVKASAQDNVMFADDSAASIPDTSAAESNGMNESDWEITEKTEDSITLGQYKGTSADVKIPSKMDGRQVYITQFPGAPARGTNTLSEDEKRIVSVTTVCVDPGSKVKAKDTTSDGCPKFGADLNSSSDAVQDQLTSVDLGAFDLEGWTSMHSMFRNRYNLTTIKGLDQWNVSNITDLGYMFSGTKFTDLSQLAHWNVGKVTRLSGMFSTKTTNIEPLRNWDVSSVTQMSDLLSGSKELESIEPISGWETSKVTDMSYMFMGCSNLKDYSPIANWKVQNVTDMQGMFAKSGMEFADFTNWDFNPNVKINNMFLSKEKQPLLIVTENEKLKNYPFAEQNRTGASLTLENGSAAPQTTDGLFVIPDLSNDTIQNIVKEQLSSRPIPMKEGYIFEKWESKQTSSNPQDALSATYEAVFKPLTFTVTFEAENNVPAPQTVPYEGLIQKPTQIPTTEKYRFAGWKVIAGPDDMIGKEWNFAEDKMPQHNLTLSPLWTDQVSVTFEYNGGSVENDESGFYQIGQKLPAPEKVTKKGYVLEGWYRDAEFTTAAWNFRVDTVPETGLTLYAKWAKPMELVNKAPVIVAKNLVVLVGDSLNPLKGVSAHDHEDGEIVLTEQNILANDVKLDTVGVYHITYGVEDRDGAVVRKTIQVTVKAAEKPDAPSNPETTPTTPTTPETTPTTPGKPGNSPTTGDTIALGLLGSMFVTSAGVCGVLFQKKHKRK